jgi:hypothetical protein
MFRKDDLDAVPSKIASSIVTSCQDILEKFVAVHPTLICEGNARSSLKRSPW